MPCGVVEPVQAGLLPGTGPSRIVLLKCRGLDQVREGGEHQRCQRMCRIVGRVIGCPHRQPPGIGDLGGDDRGDVSISRMHEEVGGDCLPLFIGSWGGEGPDEFKGGRWNVDSGFFTDFADRRSTGRFTGLGFPAGVLVQTGAVFADGQHLTPT